MIRVVPVLLSSALIACSGGTETPAPAPEPAPVAEPAPEPAPAASELAITGTAMEVKLPTGKTTTADHVAAPAEGTPEHAILTSIQLLSAGDFDTWVADWCHPSYCNAPEAILALKAHNLPAAQGTSKQCLDAAGTGVVVTRRDPPEPDGTQRIYVFCGESRMPAPSAHLLDGGKWKLTSLSW